MSEITLVVMKYKVMGEETAGEGVEPILAPSHVLGVYTCQDMAHDCAHENRSDDTVVLIQEWSTDSDNMLDCRPAPVLE